MAELTPEKRAADLAKDVVAEWNLEDTETGHLAQWIADEIRAAVEAERTRCTEIAWQEIIKQAHFGYSPSKEDFCVAFKKEGKQ